MSVGFVKKIKFFRPKKAENYSQNSIFNRILNQLQRLGRSLMFPIAVLPIAALLLRIGALIQDPLANGSIGISETQKFWGRLISTPGGIVFDNLAIIFAIGIGFGFAKDNRGEAALVAAVVWYGMSALLKQSQLAEAIYKNVLVAKSGQLKGFTQLLYFLKAGKPVYQLDSGVIGGISVGLVVAFLYNKYKNIKLPQTLSFFGGRRFVPMLGILSIIPLGLIFAIIWPWAQYGLIKIGSALSDQSANHYARGFYVSIYAFLNRLLQPFGLHHILNTFVWFQLPIKGKLISPVINQVGETVAKLGEIYTVNGDITAFNTGIIGSGGFTTGFFPLYLGGLPGAAVAMIFAAKKERRKNNYYLFSRSDTCKFSYWNWWAFNFYFYFHLTTFMTFKCFFDLSDLHVCILNWNEYWNWIFCWIYWLYCFFSKVMGVCKKLWSFGKSTMNLGFFRDNVCNSRFKFLLLY